MQCIQINEIFYKTRSWPKVKNTRNVFESLAQVFRMKILVGKSLKLLGRHLIRNLWILVQNCIGLAIKECFDYNWQIDMVTYWLIVDAGGQAEDRCEWQQSAVSTYVSSITSASPTYVTASHRPIPHKHSLLWHWSNRKYIYHFRSITFIL